AGGLSAIAATNGQHARLSARHRTVGKHLRPAQPGHAPAAAATRTHRRPAGALANARCDAATTRARAAATDPTGGASADRNVAGQPPALTLAPCGRGWRCASIAG